MHFTRSSLFRTIYYYTNNHPISKKLHSIGVILNEKGHNKKTQVQNI